MKLETLLPTIPEQAPKSVMPLKASNEKSECQKTETGFQKTLSHKLDENTDVESGDTQAQKSVTAENKASVQVEGALSDKAEALEKLDGDIREKADKIREMFEKLGIQIPENTLLDNTFLKKLVALLVQFQKEMGGHETATSSLPLDSAALTESDSEKAQVLNTLFQEAMDLKTLLDLRSFLEKSVQAGEGKDILSATTLSENTPVVQADESCEGEESNESSLGTASDTLNQNMTSKEMDPVLETDMPTLPEAEKDPLSDLVTKLLHLKQSQNKSAEIGNAKPITPEQKEAAPASAPSASVAETIDPMVSDNSTEKKSELPLILQEMGITDNSKKTETPSSTAGVTKSSVAELTDSVVQSAAANPDQNANPEKDESNKEMSTQHDKSAVSKVLSAIRTHIAEFVPPVRQAAAMENNAAVTNMKNPLPTPEHASTERNVVHQIASKFQLFTGSHGSEIQIQLKPEHLGQVKVSLEIDSQVVSARMEVENQQVKAIVETHLQQLKDALQQSGLKVERFEVSVAQENSDFFRRDLSERGRHVRGQLRMNMVGGDIDGLGSVEAGDETGRRYGYNTVEFVG